MAARDAGRRGMVCLVISCCEPRQYLAWGWLLAEGNPLRKRRWRAVFSRPQYIVDGTDTNDYTAICLSEQSHVQHPHQQLE